MEVIDAVMQEEDAKAVRLIPLPCSNIEDRWVWHFSNRGVYSVSSRFVHIMWKSSLIGYVPSMNIPPKLRHFWWKACCNFLATKQNLHRKRCNPSLVCPICLRDPESVEHLFFQCDWTNAVWFGSSLNYKVESLAISSVMNWIVPVMDHLDSAIDGPACMGKIIFLAWQIWKSRNDCVFNHMPVDPRDTMARANFGWSKFHGSLGNQEIPRKHVKQVSLVTHWECVEEGWVINTQ
ncbi:uncharacterized protein LOC131306836 [Rhododendron vialii]|uniref:uncharacterized protein LOC131306836 n=1 Tax=Rhododendron vialii TaxID=182163 RepID=UPI00265D86FB|nr:uncharacterized protein LOC131306836 [Rhododendron vialii]